MGCKGNAFAAKGNTLADKVYSMREAGWPAALSGDWSDVPGLKIELGGNWGN